MPIFRYVAKDKTGQIHRGQAEADDEKRRQSSFISQATG